MARKIKVAILFGGRSAEHEISLRSARNIAAALDPNKYDVSYIGIEKSGHWLPSSTSKTILLGASHNVNISATKALSVMPEDKSMLVGDGGGLIDVVFPVLHGPFGEDGTIQGMLKLANVPFVGPGVLGSAVGMDKGVMKRLLRDAGIPIGKFLIATKTEPISFTVAKKRLGLPLFIKPANMGSSVGVYKVKSEQEFRRALKNAFAFDTKILIEAFIRGRELECGVLGNEKPIASVVGEIIPRHEFYSYEAKYIDENGAALEIPAKIPKNIQKKIQQLAIKTYKVLSCEGMGRVDFFLKDNGEVFINEINTIPGFTSISMYPKLWEASGVPLNRLVDTLIELAIKRFKRDAKLKTSY
ncbi:MAG TPA: D-alanine--D-alanine ligase [Candidatus Paceibacterota bacterium]|nr:D-alanine--D-alanine ligase [Candidatus Paceibacterota bacterium]